MTSPIVVTPSENVTQAIETRRSVRAFLPDPIPEDVVRSILSTALRAASGGNLQPWRIYALGGKARDELVATVEERSKETPFGNGPEYEIYPPELTEPYKARRSKVAHEMYELVGIARDDRVARAVQMAQNFKFFGAPVGMIIAIDRQMGPPQYSDLGILLQNIMLLAREQGLHTCAQESWSMWGATLREVVGIPEHELIFCGLALGKADADAPINQLRTERAGLDEVATFSGF